jgi:hypothetical protein
LVAFFIKEAAKFNGEVIFGGGWQRIIYRLEYTS